MPEKTPPRETRARQNIGKVTKLYGKVLFAS